jgi:hypothetical protein
MKDDFDRPLAFRERLVNTILMRLLSFMGVSGWLIIVVIVLENRVAAPLPGGNSALDLLMLLTLAAWWLSKIEDWIRQRANSWMHKHVLPTL